MSLLDRICGRRGLSTSWERDRSLDLTIDLSRHSLCGVRLGESIEGLRGLGPCANHRRSWCDLRYPNLGVNLWAELDYVELGSDPQPAHGDPMHLETITLIIGSAAGRNYSGRVLVDGREVSLETPQSAIEELGEPFARANDSGEDILFYEHPLKEGSRWPVLECQLCFEGDQFTSLELTPFPDLADEGVRADYGVTRDWPFPKPVS